MTFEAVERGNFFVRPTLPEEFVDLADADYATFFHLAQIHEWRAHVEADPQARGIGGTEALYCFFSHARSSIDAAMSFAAAVDAVLGRYGATVAFEPSLDERGHPWRLGSGWGMRGDRARWASYFDRVRRPRNFLVHQRPVFVRNCYIPRPKDLKEVSGLTAISKLARDKGLLRERYVEMPLQAREID